MSRRRAGAVLLVSIATAALAALVAAGQPVRPLAAGEAGRGEPALVLIHGIGSDRTEWDAVSARLSGRHRIVAVDLPGHGASEPDESVRVQAVAARLDRALEERGIRRAVLVGHSYGALVALAEAAEHPKRTQGVVVVDIGSYNAADSSRIANLDMIMTRYYPAFIQNVFETMCADSTGRERLLAQAQAVPQPVLSAYFRDAWRADLRPSVARIRAPILVVATSALWPEETPWDSVRAALGYAGARRATAVRIPLSNHFVPLDAPDSLAAVIERFAGTLR